MKTVVLGIASGIAAYKILDLVNALREQQIEVFVIMTNHAAKMIDPAEFEKASGNTVSVKLFNEQFDYRKILKDRKVDHIDLADRADVYVIAPATANIIAKLAYGHADDFLTTAALAVTSPIILCPSMNVHMWSNPVVQENILILKKRGFLIVDPEPGPLACGYEGMGRLAGIQTIKENILQELKHSESLKNKKIIVTAGGTIEKIDDVRFIANRSSGKMGIAIADTCRQRGADVLLLRAKNAVKPRFVMQEEIFSTAEELLELVQKHVASYDYFYHTAAVSDFTVENKQMGKISSKKHFTITLKPQIKIIEQIKKLNPKIKLIAFKAEYTSDEKELIQKATIKLKESSADVVIANDVSKSDRGFEVDQNEVYIVDKNGLSKHLPLETKRNLARDIVSYIHNDLFSTQK